MPHDTHKPGVLYRYRCPKCAYDRGLLERPDYVTSCPECRYYAGYTVTEEQDDATLERLKKKYGP